MCRLEKKEDGSIDFYYQGKDGETKSINCGLVLFGTGRKPIVWDMGLEVSALPPSFACMRSCRGHLGGQALDPLPPPFAHSPSSTTSVLSQCWKLCAMCSM